jgi:hypothetical protein
MVSIHSLVLVLENHSTGSYQLMHFWVRQPFERNSTGRDNGAASADFGTTSL